MATSSKQPLNSEFFSRLLYNPTLLLPVIMSILQAMTSLNMCPRHVKPLSTIKALTMMRVGQQQLSVAA